MVRGAGAGVQEPAPGRLGARDLPQGETGSARRGGEAEDPGRAGRQVRAVRLRADGPRGAGEAGFCGQRAQACNRDALYAQRAGQRPLPPAHPVPDGFN